MENEPDIHALRSQIREYLTPGERYVKITPEEAEATEIGNWIGRASKIVSYVSTRGEWVSYSGFHPKNGLEAIEAARNKNRHAHAALLSIARMTIVLGQPVPPPLSSYVAKVLMGETPKMKTGKASMHLRDEWILNAIQIAVVGGMLATRSDASREKDGNHSACSLVKEILDRDFGFAVSENAINKVWQSHNPIKI